MSFEILVQCFNRGKFAGIPREQVRSVFGEQLRIQDLNDWILQYDHQNYCRIGITPLKGDESLVHHLTVHRPCGDERLYIALFSVLKLGNMVLYYPGCKAPFIAESAVVSHLPFDMIDALGVPVCVQSAMEIMREIERS